MLKYVITSTEAWTYLDDQRRPVNGFRVNFSISDLNEAHAVYVPSLETGTVKKSVEALIADREKLAALGK